MSLTLEPRSGGVPLRALIYHRLRCLATLIEKRAPVPVMKSAWVLGLLQRALLLEDSDSWDCDLLFAEPATRALQCTLTIWVLSEDLWYPDIARLGPAWDKNL